MKVVIHNEKGELQHTIYDDSVRIPVKGDYICHHARGVPKSILEEMPDTMTKIVKKVMIDYVQDIAIVTVKET